jgi:nucleoside-diphosphate-sugar epimerase
VEHFIFFSTGGVYGPTDGWVDEESPLNPQGDYCQSKALAEQAILASSLHIVTVIRLYFPIGPFSRPHFFANLNRRLAYGTAFLNDAEGHPWISPFALNDLAPVLVAVLDLGLDGVFNLSGNEAITLREIADLLAEVGGFDKITPPDCLKAGSDFLGNSDKIIRATALKKPFTPPMEALRHRALESVARSS